MSWREINLGQAIKVKHGFAFDGKFFTADGELMVLTPGNFLERGGFRVRPGKERFYIGDFPDEYSLAEGDLIVAMTEQGEGLLGSSAWIPESGKYLHNQRLGLISACNPDLLDKRFLYWLFNTPIVRGQIRGSATGTKVRHTAPERIYRVTVAVPPVTAQRRIAQTLDAYDDLIENNQRRIKLLEEAARKLYREWFVALRFPGHERVNVVDGVPHGWHRGMLTDFAVVNQSSLSPRNPPDSLLYVDIASVGTGVINDSTEYSFADAPGRARRRVTHGDTIWSCVRPNRRSYALIWEPPGNFIASTGFAVLTPLRVPYTFLHLAVTTDEFVAHLTANATGAAYPAVTSHDFETAAMLEPSASVLAEFDRIVRPWFGQQELLKKQVKVLKQARDALLPRLMSGELGV